MEPLDLVDVSSTLRGIGHRAARTNPVRAWHPSTHVKPWEYAARWEESVGNPKATRNPALGAAYVFDTPLAPGFTADAAIDARAAADIIGVPTRVGARVACRTSAKR